MSIIDKMFNQETPGFEKAMDLTWRRGQAIISNVANAETPRYRAVDLDFGSELKQAFQAQESDLKTTSENHFDTVSNNASHLTADLSGATKADGNNVDIDVQMGKLHRNQAQYMQAATILRQQLRIIMSAIRGASV